MGILEEFQMKMWLVLFLGKTDLVDDILGEYKINLNIIVSLKPSILW